MSMNKLSKALAVVTLITVSFSLQSCIVVAAMGGLGAMKFGDAKKAEAETKCKKEYPNYYTSMDKINKQKSTRHEKTEPIMTLNEYCHVEADEKTDTQKNEVKK